MESLDAPIQLKFNNGNLFPTNFQYIAYAFLVGALLLMLLESAFILGGVLMLLGIGVVTNRHIVEISEQNNFVHDYSLYFGFLKIGKKYPLDKYKYVTNMPLIESNTVMANMAQTTTDTNASFTVTLFGERLRGKRLITKYDSRNEAHEKASQLADRLRLKYFQYDPQLVRDVLTGKRTL
ncbi:MAG: hypothetical protein AB8B56_01565 [Crocinitomicaceae bacterium]